LTAWCLVIFVLMRVQPDRPAGAGMMVVPVKVLRAEHCP
jgi:hypothetical protein